MNEVITIGLDIAKNVFQVHGVDCVLSGNLAEHQVGLGDRLRLIGDEPVRGISEPIKIYELRRSG